MVVLSVRPGSTAARIGFQPGDVILQVGRRQDRDGDASWKACCKERQRLWQVVFKRGNQLRQLQVAG